MSKRDHTPQEVALPQRATTLREEARKHLFEGRYFQAEALFLEAIALRESTGDNAQPYRAHSSGGVELATVLADLGMLYWRLGRYPLSEDCLRRALVLRKMELGENHPSVGEALSDLAGVYRYRGQYEEAHSLLVKALQIQETALGTEHPSVATTLRNQAALLRDKGDFSRVEKVSHWALFIFDNAYSPNSTEAASVYKVLGFFYACTGQHEEGERASRLSLEVLEDRLGKKHPLLGGSLLNLGHHLKAKKKQAVVFYERALALYESSYGASHPFIAITLSYLAPFFSKQDSYKTKLSYHQRALSIYEQTHGPTHRFTRGYVLELARALEERQELTEAEALYLRALEISRKSGSVHEVVYDLFSLGMLQYNRQHWEAAEKSLSEALSLAKGEKSNLPTIESLLGWLRAVYQKQNKEEQARALQEEALALKQSSP